MIIASGFIEINGVDNIQQVTSELQSRGIELCEIEDNKVFFQVKSSSLSSIKYKLESLRGSDFINNVSLAYYSLENRLR